TGEQEHMLVIICHHIICDEWSDEIFLRELVAAYEAYSEGRELCLPELPIQYADFASWQRETFQGEALERQLNYWREHLKDREILQLATDRPRPRVATAN